MTRNKTCIFIAACTASLGLAHSSLAAESSYLDIAATLVGTCKFTNQSSSGNYELLFGTLDSNATHDAVKSVPVSYYCTSGTAASSIKIAGGDSGETLSIGAGSAVLPVTLTWSTPTSAGAGFAPAVPPITFSVTGTIPAARIKTAPAGRYFGRFPIAILP